jgi:mono/diheme cytochrome c family protein
MKKLLATTAVACAIVGAVYDRAFLQAAEYARSQTAPTVAPAGDAKTYRAFVNKYCVSCHNSRNAQGGTDPVNLEKASLDDVLSSAATWERVLRKLSVRAMPPQGMPRPQEAEYAAFTAWLANSVDQAWAARGTSPGRYVVHRLNRTEYGNAVRDLLAIDVDVTSLLPSDGGEFGFDNIATSLKTSPLLLERYVTAAQRISALAVGDPNERPGTTEYLLTREFSQNSYIEGLPLGTRGGTVVRHIFPADGEYKLAARLFRGIEEGYVGVEGNDTPNTFVLTIDGEEVFSTAIGGPKDHEEQSKSLTETQPILDARLTARVPVTAGPHDVAFTWRDRPAQRQDVFEPALRDSQEVHMVGGFPRIRSALIEGPYNATGVAATPSRERIFVCRPASTADAKEEAACAERIFTSLTRHAYRRPVATADVQAPMDFYRDARQSGETFDSGIRSGLSRILSSPSFLYRIESDPAGIRPGAAHPVSDVDLASRLSFFLWSSIPDEHLLNLAAPGRLRQPGVLGAEVKRMIADRRADALISNFTGQWLQLRNIDAKVAPDLLMFPDFDDNIRKGFRRETEMLFGYILRNDRSALELLNADYTFVNERLAKHYGIPGVYGERFRQVKLTDPNRFGLLGHGSILSMTALATRTSPVFRGKYVLDTFLNTPPPPPPPNVPTLDESNKDAPAVPKSVREQLELHRKNPACAGCHRVIDPPGFALENFNSIGQWRTAMENGAKIDANGMLADGTSVNGPVELRQAMLSRPEAFVTNVTERMMIYALGRGLEPSDMPVVRRIVRQASKNGYRLSAIVNGIIESAPFQMRTRLDSAQPNTTGATTVGAVYDRLRE